MTFDPILTAPLAVQIHLVAAVLAVSIGPIAIYRTRRDRVHKIVGRTWVTAMAVLAISGFFIPAAIFPLVGVFGPIHLLSAWALFSLTRGVRAILRRDVARHRSEMRALYWHALGIAGLLTLLPGRTLNGVFFGTAEYLGVWVIVGAGTLTVLILGARWARRPAL